MHPREDEAAEQPGSVRFSNLPPVHRWILCFGLVLFAAWFSANFVITFAESYAPMMSHALREPVTIILVLGLSCIAFGILTEVCLNLVVWRKVRALEAARLSDLCGRTRFDRGRKKYKRVRIDDQESVTL